MTKAAIDPRSSLFIGGFGCLYQDERSFKEETAFWNETSASDAARQCGGEGDAEKALQNGISYRMESGRYKGISPANSRRLYAIFSVLSLSRAAGKGRWSYKQRPPSLEGPPAATSSAALYRCASAGVRAALSGSGDKISPANRPTRISPMNLQSKGTGGR